MSIQNFNNSKYANRTGVLYSGAATGFQPGGWAGFFRNSTFSGIRNNPKETGSKLKTICPKLTKQRNKTKEKCKKKSSQSSRLLPVPTLNFVAAPDYIIRSLFLMIQRLTMNRWTRIEYRTYNIKSVYWRQKIRQILYVQESCPLSYLCIELDKTSWTYSMPQEILRGKTDETCICGCVCVVPYPRSYVINDAHEDRTKVVGVHYIVSNYRRPTNMKIGQYIYLFDTQ